MLNWFPDHDQILRRIPIVVGVSNTALSIARCRDAPRLQQGINNPRPLRRRRRLHRQPRHHDGCDRRHAHSDGSRRPTLALVLAARPKAHHLRSRRAPGQSSTERPRWPHCDRRHQRARPARLAGNTARSGHLRRGDQCASASNNCSPGAFLSGPTMRSEWRSFSPCFSAAARPFGLSMGSARFGGRRICQRMLILSRQSLGVLAGAPARRRLPDHDEFRSLHLRHRLSLLRGGKRT